MQATINSSISLRREHLSAALEFAIREELTFPNPEKARAISERVQGAGDLPDEVSLTSGDDDPFWLHIPRGFVHRLEELAQAHEQEIDWERQMTITPTSQRCFADWKPIELRGYQETALHELLGWVSGICMAPTGAGKTRIALEVARWAGQRTLIIVDKTALAAQWLTAIKDSYGYDAGLIGDGQWNEREMTVCLRQTLWSRRDSISGDWWARFGMLISDEVHHASSETLFDLVQRFPAFYRLGYSATPEWDEALFPYITAVVGPIVHRTSPEDTKEHLFDPNVVVLETDFERQYVPTHMDGHRRISNNYREIAGDLIRDDHRNKLIAKTALDDASQGHCVLITTQRTEHVAEIIRAISEDWWGYKGISSIFELTGKQSHEYEVIRTCIANTDFGVILVSTIANEALDIPRLDRLIMAYPARNVRLIEQQIGRIRRQAPKKTDALVYDVLDVGIGVMKAQYQERAQKLYMRRRWPVERRERVVA